MPAELNIPLDMLSPALGSSLVLVASALAIDVIALQIYRPLWVIVCPPSENHLVQIQQVRILWWAVRIPAPSADHDGPHCISRAHGEHGCAPWDLVTCTSAMIGLFQLDLVPTAVLVPALGATLCGYAALLKDFISAWGVSTPRVSFPHQPQGVFSRRHPLFMVHVMVELG